MLFSPNIKYHLKVRTIILSIAAIASLFFIHYKAHTQLCFLNISILDSQESKFIDDYLSNPHNFVWFPITTDTKFGINNHIHCKDVYESIMHDNLTHSTDILKVKYSSAQVREYPQESAYPPIARLLHLEEKVLVDVYIDHTGHPIKATAINASKYFRKYSEDYLMRWKFIPLVPFQRCTFRRMQIILAYKLNEPFPWIDKSLIIDTRNLKSSIQCPT